MATVWRWDASQWCVPSKRQHLRQWARRECQWLQRRANTNTVTLCHILGTRVIQVWLADPEKPLSNDA